MGSPFSSSVLKKQKQKHSLRSQSDSFYSHHCSEGCCLTCPVGPEGPSGKQGRAGFSLPGYTSQPFQKPSLKPCQRPHCSQDRAQTPVPALSLKPPCAPHRRSPAGLLACDPAWPGLLQAPSRARLCDASLPAGPPLLPHRVKCGFSCEVWLQNHPSLRKFFFPLAGQSTFSFSNPLRYSITNSRVKRVLGIYSYMPGAGPGSRETQGIIQTRLLLPRLHPGAVGQTISVQTR